MLRLILELFMSHLSLVIVTADKQQTLLIQ